MNNMPVAFSNAVTQIVNNYKLDGARQRTSYREDFDNGYTGTVHFNIYINSIPFYTRKDVLVNLNDEILCKLKEIHAECNHPYKLRVYFDFSFNEDTRRYIISY